MPLPASGQDESEAVIPVVYSGPSSNDNSTSSANTQSAQGTSRSTDPGNNQDGLVDIDVAKLRAQAHVVYLSSGSTFLGGRLIDSNPGSFYQFSGGDLHPTVIVELALRHGIHRVTAAFNPREDASVETFLLNTLPKNRGDLTGGLPVKCSISWERGLKVATAEFVANKARYVAFRWTREKTSEKPFGVAEVDAFAHDTAPKWEFAPETPQVAAIDVPTEPPHVAVVSP